MEETKKLSNVKIKRQTNIFGGSGAIFFHLLHQFLKFLLQIASRFFTLVGDDLCSLICFKISFQIS